MSIHRVSASIFPPIFLLLAVALLLQSPPYKFDCDKYWHGVKWWIERDDRELAETIDQNEFEFNGVKYRPVAASGDFDAERQMPIDLTGPYGGANLAFVLEAKNKAGRRLILLWLNEREGSRVLLNSRGRVRVIAENDRGGYDWYAANARPRRLFQNGRLDLNFGLVKLVSAPRYNHPNSADISGSIDIGTIAAGDLKVRTIGHQVFISGIIGLDAYRKFKALLEGDRQIRTVHFGNVGGSVDISASNEIGLLLRKHIITTRAGPRSQIASGGVTMFLGGAKRIVHPKARFGVHSSCCSCGVEARDLPLDAEYHNREITYLESVLGKDKGASTHFELINAAPFASMKYLDVADLRRLGIATSIEE